MSDIDLSTAEGPAPDAIVETGLPSPANPDGGAPPVPEYTPNFSFKVKNDEHAFDERIRPAITSKEVEDHLRDIYTKAYGLDGVKARAEEYEKKWKEDNSRYLDLNSRHEKLNNVLQRVNDIRTKDFGTFQRVWEIPDAAIIDRAKEIISVMNDHDARNRLNQVYDDRVMQLNQQNQVQQYDQSTKALQREVHEMKMLTSIQSPEVSSFAAEYDKRMGQGAFRREVDNYGTVYFHENQGRYLPPQDAVSAVHQRLKSLMGPITPASAQQSEEQEPVDKIQVAPIPNMGSGKTGAPVARRKFKSVDEMRQYAKTLE